MKGAIPAEPRPAAPCPECGRDAANPSLGDYLTEWCRTCIYYREYDVMPPTRWHTFNRVPPDRVVEPGKGADMKGANPKQFPMSQPTPKGKAGDPVSKGNKTRTTPTMRPDHGPGMNRGR